MSEIGPRRTELSDLTPAEITDRMPTRDVAQSMADELTPGQLRDKLADTTQRIEQKELALAFMQEEVGALEWLRGEINRAIQLADDMNPGHKLPESDD